MTKTKFLTGHEESRYIEQLKPLADMRITDMRELLNTIRTEAKAMRIGSPEYLEITYRYQEIEKAIIWWEKLLIEGTVEHE